MNRVSIRRVAIPLASIPLARAGASGIRFAGSVAMAKRRGESIYPDVPTPDPTPGLAADVALDELFLQPAGLAGSLAAARHYEQSSHELDTAVRYYEDAGWLDDPAGRFPSPPPACDVAFEPVVWKRRSLELLQFPSDWRPDDDEPGAARWQSVEANRTVYAAVMRHDGPRPWLVCLHGQSMGRLSDIDTFRLRHLHEDLGVNILLPTLPLHGRRRAGLAIDRQFVSAVYPVNNVLGLTQTMWDVRRILGWLRDEQQATAVGVYGFSLGSYAAALLSTIERDLECVIAVVPSGDIAAPLKDTVPTLPSLRRAHNALHDWRALLVQGVVSPLARPCLVPHARRYIMAGQADRLATPAGAVMLWRHWERPEIDWYPRGHLTLARSVGYEARVADMLRQSGIVAA